MAISFVWKVFAGIGEGRTATVKAVGIMYMLTAGLKTEIVSTCVSGDIGTGGMRSCRTVSLSQLIQRGIMILVKVMAHAVEIESAQAQTARDNVERHTSQESDQRSDVYAAPSHCGRKFGDVW